MATAVIGAGMAGLVIALRLAQRGEDVCVFDRDNVPGGLAAGFQPVEGGDWLERFYHHIFRSDRAIVRLARELQIEKDLLWQRPVTACLYDGKLQQLDSAGSLLRFSPLSRSERARLAFALGILKAAPSAQPFERLRADEWLRAVAGDRAYGVVFEPLFRAKFGDHAPEISLAWFWARIHDRTPQLGYVLGGFATLYRRLVECVTAAGGVVYLGASVSSIKSRGTTFDLQLQCDGETSVHQTQKVVSTIPLHRLKSICADLPPEFLRRYEPRPGLAARCVVLALDRPLTGVYWINICEPQFPFMVLVEHTALIPADRYAGRHLVYIGNYGASFPNLSIGEVVSSFVPYLRRINPDFSEQWVTAAWQFVAPDAQPIVTTAYAQTIAPHVTPLRGLFLANMYQVYPHDRGQNYAVELAESVVKAMHEPVAV